MKSGLSSSADETGGLSSQAACLSRLQTTSTAGLRIAFVAWPPSLCTDGFFQKMACPRRRHGALNYTCYKLSDRWNGHWASSKRLRSMVYGRRCLSFTRDQFTEEFKTVDDRYAPISLASITCRRSQIK
jgi:hypothetical protein